MARLGFRAKVPVCRSFGGLGPGSLTCLQHGPGLIGPFFHSYWAPAGSRALFLGLGHLKAVGSCTEGRLPPWRPPAAPGAAVDTQYSACLQRVVECKGTWGGGLWFGRDSWGRPLGRRVCVHTGRRRWSCSVWGRAWPGGARSPGTCSQLHGQWCHVRSLKLAVAGAHKAVDTRKLQNTTNQGSPLSSIPTRCQGQSGQGESRRQNQEGTGCQPAQRAE